MVLAALPISVSTLPPALPHTLSILHPKLMKMLASDTHPISTAGSPLGSQASLSASQIPTLEMRVIALETKLRHHKPEHPCDCKYELSLLEEKLGGLDEHPWELRISEVEQKQRRDAKDVSRLWKELRECQDRTETLMAEHHWVSSQEKGVDRVKSTNTLYLMEQTIEKLREFERSQEELAACLVGLKKRCDEMEGDIRRVQPWMINQMVEKQENVADKIARLNGNAKTLENRVGELMALKGVISKQLDTISDTVDSKGSEEARTIANIASENQNTGVTEDDLLSGAQFETRAPRATGSQILYYGNNSERSIWVPPTSGEPTHTPYTHGIPTVLEQPEGWGDVRAEICRQLEESQKAYFSSQPELETKEKSEATDGEVVEISLARSPEEVSQSEPDISKKKRKRVRKRSKSKSPTFNAINEENKPVLKVESEQADENVESETIVLSEYLHPSDSCHPTVSAVEYGHSTRNTDADARFFKLFAKSLSSKKSRPSLRKSKSKTIVKSNCKDKTKSIPVSELFKQDKGINNGKSASKTILESGTIPGLEVLMLR